MRSATCGSGDRPGCGEPIWWLRHVGTNRRAPIDQAPNGYGNVRPNLVSETYEVLSGRVLAEARAAGEPLHLNHFTTCPLRANFGGKQP